MYQLQKQTITKIKRAFKNRSPNPFEWEELEAERNKKHKAPKPKHPENLWIDVYQDLKIKTDLVTWMKENGLSITPIKEASNLITPLAKLLNSLDLHWQDFIWDKLKETDIYLPKKLMDWYDTIKKFQDDFDTFIISVNFIEGDYSGDWTKFNDFNNLIHNYCYDFHWTVDMNEFFGTAKELEAYKLIDDYLSSFILMMDQVCVVKNFLIRSEEKTKKSYIITDSSQSTAIIKQQGEFKKMDRSLFIKPEKTELERITEKASKFMGLTISINDPNKKEFFWINKLDETKYCYFAFGIAAREITTTTKQGKKLKKYVFNFDHLKNPVYIPQWMALMACDENNNPFWVVAVNKTEYTKALILDLASLTASEPDIVEEIDKSNKDNFKIIY